MVLPTVKYRRKLFRFAVVSLLLMAAGSQARPQADQVHTVLILYEGKDIPLNYGKGDARELAMLLGHFPEIDYKLEPVESYAVGDIGKFDLTFFIGFSKFYVPPDRFLHDVANDEKQFIWLNTGIDYFNKIYDLNRLFGFHFVGFDSVSQFDAVTSGKNTFTKGEPNLNLIAVAPNE